VKRDRAAVGVDERYRSGRALGSGRAASSGGAGSTCWAGWPRWARRSRGSSTTARPARKIAWFEVDLAQGVVDYLLGTDAVSRQQRRRRCNASARKRGEERDICDEAPSQVASDGQKHPDLLSN
jgi:hypothetical protein